MTQVWNYFGVVILLWTISRTCLVTFPHYIDPLILMGQLAPFVILFSFPYFWEVSNPVLNLSLRCDLVLKRELDISGFGVDILSFFLIV